MRQPKLEDVEIAVIWMEEIYSDNGYEKTIAESITDWATVNREDYALITKWVSLNRHRMPRPSIVFRQQSNRMAKLVSEIIEDQREKEEKEKAKKAKKAAEAAKKKKLKLAKEAEERKKLFDQLKQEFEEK